MNRLSNLNESDTDSYEAPLRFYPISNTSAEPFKIYYIISSFARANFSSFGLTAIYIKISKNVYNIKLFNA